MWHCLSTLVVKLLCILRYQICQVLRRPVKLGVRKQNLWVLSKSPQSSPATFAKLYKLYMPLCATYHLLLEHSRLCRQVTCTKLTIARLLYYAFVTNVRRLTTRKLACKDRRVTLNATFENNIAHRCPYQHPFTPNIKGFKVKFHAYINPDLRCMQLGKCPKSLLSASGGHQYIQHQSSSGTLDTARVLHPQYCFLGFSFWNSCNRNKCNCNK